MTQRTRIGSVLVPISLLGSALVLMPLPAMADAPSPSMTVHPQTQGGSPQSDSRQTPPSGMAMQAKPVDPDARMEADRAAFFSARLAALHAGLGLTADQEALWPPVEAALRDLVKTGHHAWRHRPDGDRDLTAIERLKRRGDRLVQRGQAIGKLADATGPLLSALTAEQRDRLPMLLRGVRHHSVVARAFELRRDDMDRDDMDRDDMRRDDTDHDGGGPYDRGMSGHDRQGHAMNGSGLNGRGMNGPGMNGPGMDGPGMDGPGMDGERYGRAGGGMGSERDGGRQGMNGDEPPTMHRHHHRDHDDDDGGFEDISVRS